MLVVENLSVEIAGVKVLRSLGFELKAGVRSVLIGRNGAGKTTTLRAIMGLLPREGGKVTLDGREIQDLPSHERARLGIGYAPEDRRLIAGFSIEDNILLPALALDLPAAERKRRLEEVYAFLPQLAQLKDRPGGGVSGGQGKMVALGRALMVADRVLFLDEPFQGLAPALALDYARTLARLRDHRPEIAVLVTESSPKLLDDVADETLLIERGAVSRA
ncbi:ATP-binding cassette domain-containing protein [Albimonas pacifica]|uniref:Amino acid/amide ABC transporter ATP-binding protein 2, HAAT family n=1 Tax=Albimonas pacifica TaxID=1114924 RepID=A0A1I3FCJ2_9RHOB|nr:ATP-binding cassette domain-containing protein [Albimonas pacifica]SFI08956.1 amino acid/amide ABC transporter ATP-binding protein 2, HAAT family [Albimonas pacifica]